MSVPIHIAVLLVGAVVTLQSNDGKDYVGSLEQLDAQQAMVMTGTGEQRVPLVDVIRMTNDETKSIVEKPVMTVTLTDGSTLGAKSFQLSKTANVSLAQGVQTELDARSLSTVRFRNPGYKGPLNGEWKGIIERPFEGDLLIVRKGHSLSYLEGTVRSVNEDIVDFVFDGSDFQVARSKVEGLKFLTRKPTKKRADQAVYVLGPGLLQSRSIAWTDGNFEVTLVCGDTIRLPMKAVRLIDFAATRVVYLSALEPYKTTVTPRIGTTVLQDFANRLIYKPGVNQSLSGKRLSLTGSQVGEDRQYFDRGLAIHSRTDMIYRIDDGEFTRLKGIAGLDPDLKQTGTVRLLIEADDQPLLDQNLGPGDLPVPIDLEISGVRRLRILVDYGDKLDAADHLNLCEIRLTP